jgi:hypothetical protein
MIGYTVYIMMRREVLSGKDTLLSLHATFDGAFYAMKAERDYAIEKGYTVEGDLDNFQVLECGRLVKRFWVQTRTIEE